MVLKAAALKVIAFWYVTPCILVNWTYSPAKHASPILKGGTCLRNYTVLRHFMGDR